jgi:hypothetical protein
MGQSGRGETFPVRKGPQIGQEATGRRGAGIAGREGRGEGTMRQVMEDHGARGGGTFAKLWVGVCEKGRQAEAKPF